MDGICGQADILVVWLRFVAGIPSFRVKLTDNRRRNCSWHRQELTGVSLYFQNQNWRSKLTQNRSHVIEWHLEKIQSSTTERLVFFYCSQKRGKRTPPEDIFRSLVAQLAQSVDGSSIARSVKREYENREKSELSLDECRHLLVGLVGLYQQTTVVVDALDECEDHTRLLLNLEMVSRNAPKAIKFFFSSRTNVKLPEDFPTWEKLELDSQKSLTVEDMKTYIQTQVKDRKTLRLGSRLLNGKDEGLEDRLVETLTRRAQGM